MGLFKLDLHYGKAKFGSKSDMFPPMWPWNLMDDLASNHSHLSVQTGVTVWKLESSICCPAWPGIWRMTLQKWCTLIVLLIQELCTISEPSVNSNWSYIPETPNLGQNRKCFLLCDPEIWQMTLQNNRPPLLSPTKLCVSFIAMWIPAWLTVRKRLDWVFTSVTLTFCMVIISVSVNNFEKFHHHTMAATLSKRCDRQTDRRTDGRTEIGVLRAAWSQLNLTNTRQGSHREYRKSPRKYLPCINMESRNSNCGLTLDYHRNSESNKMAKQRGLHSPASLESKQSWWSLFVVMDVAIGMISGLISKNVAIICDMYNICV